MTARAVDLLGVEIGPNHPIGQRLRDWLAPWPAKELARMFPGTQPRTAKSWKAGNPPQFRALAAMADRWGSAFLEYLFAPVLDESDLALERRLERIGRDVEIIKKEVRRAENGSKNSGAAACGTGRVACQPSAKASADKRFGGLAKGAGQTLAALALIFGLATPDDDWVRLARAPKIPARIVRVLQREV